MLVACVTQESVSLAQKHTDQRPIFIMTSTSGKPFLWSYKLEDLQLFEDEGFCILEVQ
jgi:hypothetical protein